MALTPEEQRALEYQAAEKRREVFLRAQQAALTPKSQERANQTRKNWDPLIRRP